MSSERGEDGQMMLLAAIVLLVAFLALTTLVARVAVVEQETGREISPAILREVELVVQVVCSAPFTELAQLEARRGFLLTQEAVGYAITDGRSTVQFDC